MYLSTDFKAEIIVLYLEAIAAHSCTCAEFDRLVSDHACSLIHSETELGEFYRRFLLTLRFLILKGRLGMPERLRAFLGSLGPRLAIAVRTQLERMFPDHFPEDPYEAHDIYEATQLTLAWEHAVLLVELPRAAPMLDLPTPRPLTSIQPVLPPLSAFPPARQTPSSMPCDLTPVRRMLPSQPSAPSVVST